MRQFLKHACLLIVYLLPLITPDGPGINHGLKFVYISWHLGASLTRGRRPLQGRRNYCYREQITQLGAMLFKCQPTNPEPAPQPPFVSGSNLGARCQTMGIPIPRAHYYSVIQIAPSSPTETTIQTLFHIFSSLPLTPGQPQYLLPWPGTVWPCPRLLSVGIGVIIKPTF